MLAGMELRQLRYFVAVAEQGNISQAAKRIFLTQSALSRQIKALEDEIGQCLLERQAHSIRLTPAGQATFQVARTATQAFLARRLAELAPEDRAMVIQAMQFLRPLFTPGPEIQSEPGR